MTGEEHLWSGVFVFLQFEPCFMVEDLFFFFTPWLLVSPAPVGKSVTMSELGLSVHQANGRPGVYVMGWASLDLLV